MILRSGESYRTRYAAVGSPKNQIPERVKITQAFFDCAFFIFIFKQRKLLIN